MFRLRTESIDDEAEETDHETMDAAIAAASKWFAEGYNNKTIGDHTRKEVQDELAELASDLRSGQEFYCNRFHERISVKVVDA